MQTFLDEVAIKILSSNLKMDQVKIVVPSIRAINFLKESIKKVIDRPIITPSIVSISEFLEHLSGIRLANNLELLYSFYEVYKEYTPKVELESFNQFFGWAPTLIGEFNELDQQLVNAKELFSYMNALGDIESWGTQEKGELSKRYFKLQGKFFLYYQKLYEKLLKKQKGYSGIQMREAIKNIALYIQQDIPQHFFVGFNALTKSEETLIQELISEGKAEIFWDIDKAFFEDPYHSAGHFIRKYHKEWNVLKKSKNLKFRNIFSKSKKIQILSTVNNTIQAKTAINIACKQDKNKSTVVVLGDEELLKPALSVLPDQKTSWNITMGYPLKNTSLMGFFKSYFDLHENYSDKGYPYRTCYEFSKTAFSRAILKNSESEFYRWIEKCNLSYVTSGELCSKGPQASLLFTPFKNVNQFLKQLIKITNTLKNIYSKSKEDPFKIETCHFFLLILDSLYELYHDHNFMTSLTDLKMIFETLIAQESFDFKGDPLSGIQIMGLLETRLLDFENVIITNLNESILPKGKRPFSWIPFDVRKKFGMNTFIEQDHLYAYHFFRLLQRAKNVHLLYNISSEGLFTAEPSRFLIQLEYFKEAEHNLEFNQIELPVPKLSKEVKEVKKTKAVLDHLDQMAEEGFSPSSLTQYIRSPYSFYEHYMLNIREAVNWNEHLTNVNKGTIMHEVLESLYFPYLSKVMNVIHYNKMIELLPEILKNKFHSLSLNEKKITGKNALIYQIMEKVLKQFLLSEKKQVEEGDRIQILALEHQFKKTIYVNTLDKKFIFKGTVDRIDFKNDILRFVDYKTGKTTISDMTFGQWDEVRTQPKKNPLFQVLMYAYLLNNDFQNKRTIAGVIPLKTFKNNFLPVSIRENRRKKHVLEIEAVILKEFERELFKLIGELYDPSLPFKEIEAKYI